MQRNATPRTWHPASVLLLALVAGCASESATPPAPPTEASITEEAVAEATVVSIDKATRQITLERADGPRLVMVAGPDFRNFDQVEAGMKVKARYGVTVSVRRLAPEETEAAPTAAAGAARARLGEKPAGGIVAGLSMTVKVVSVDLAQHVVTFTDPDGALRAVKAQRDEGRRFVDGLKPGDRVEIVYAEGVALSVE